MNTHLIAVTTGQIDDHNVQLVDARRLHEFLKVRRDFSTWVKGRVQEYGFVEGEDFITFDSPDLVNQTSRGGDRRSIAYILTLDMAKELAMVERTPRGRQARRYFIDCERQLQVMRAQGVGAASMALEREYPMVIDLLNADISAVNRQAWADVAGENAARFHARREALLRQQRQLSNQAAYQTLMKFNRPVWAR